MTKAVMSETAERGTSGRGNGAKKVTIRQVAAKAGVSRATASRVINGGDLVSEKSRVAVERAISELGFVPHPVARNLARGRTGSVGLVIPEPNTRVLVDPFFAEAVVGLSSFMENLDLQVVLLVARPGRRMDRIGDYLLGGHVDGAVVASHHRGDTINQRLVASDLPCVFVGRPLGVLHANYVDMDNVGGAQAATEHLVSQGHQRIATIAGPSDTPSGIDRLSGWRMAVQNAHLSTDPVAYGDFSRDGGAEAMAVLLDADPSIDAVFAASDLMAAGAMQTIAARGLRVPDDIAVMGFDDFAVAEQTSPPLSTVSQPVRSMAARAGSMLHELMQGGEPSARTVLFAAQLKLRESA